jgi:hypothetical protein
MPDFSWYCFNNICLYAIIDVEVGDSPFQTNIVSVLLFFVGCFVKTTTSI